MSRDLLLRSGTALIVLSIALGLASTLPVMAQTPGVTMTVTPYLGGHVKYGEWLPLRVSLSNTGGDLNAEVRAEVATSSGQATYAAPAPLPAGARKEMVLYILPPTFAQAVDVRLVQGDQVLAKSKGVPVSPHPQNEYVIAAVASDPDAFALLNGLVLPSRPQTRLIPFSLAGGSTALAEILPDRFEALRSLDCLILTGVDTSAVTPAQGEALYAWVEGGGRLLIGGGAGARRTLAGLPEGLRPVQPGPVVELADLDALADYAGAPVQVPGPFPATLPADPSDGGWPVISQDGQPLLVQKPVGDGWVSYLALDPSASPFDAWGVALTFWQKLLEPGAALSNTLPPDIPLRVLEAEQMNYALSNLPALDLPSIRWLALLLGVYILLIGPGNYLLLRRWRRLGWAWLTVPVLTLTFSVGSYGLGHRMRGSEVIVNQISLLPLSSEGGRAAVRSYVGLFSPTRASYDIRVGGEALISPLSYDPGGGWRGPAPSTYGALDVLQGDPALVRGLGVNQWAMQTFQAETTVDASALALDVAVETQGSQVQGTVYNRLGRPIRDVILVSGNRFAELGDLDAGQEKEVEAKLQGGDPGPPFPWALFEEFNRGPEPPPREVTLRRTILEAYFHTNWGPPAVPESPLLLGWTDLELLDVQVEGVRATREQTTLVVAPVPLPVVDGRATLPPGLLSGRTVEADGEAGECGASRAYVGRGRVTLEYRLPAKLRGLVPTALTAHASQADGPPGQLPPLSLLDWAGGDWVLLEGLEAGRPYDVVDPERYVNPANGVIRLQAQRDQGIQGGGCYQFDVGLEGEIKVDDSEGSGQ